MARMAYRPYRHVSQVLYVLNSLSFRAACVAVCRDRVWPICALNGHFPGSACSNHMGDQGRRGGRAPRKATIAKRPCLISASRSLDVRGELSEARLKGRKRRLHHPISASARFSMCLVVLMQRLSMTVSHEAMQYGDTTSKLVFWPQNRKTHWERTQSQLCRGGASACRGRDARWLAS